MIGASLITAGPLGLESFGVTMAITSALGSFLFVIEMSLTLFIH